MTLNVHTERRGRAVWIWKLFFFLHSLISPKVLILSYKWGKKIGLFLPFFVGRNVVCRTFLFVSVVKGRRCQMQMLCVREEEERKSSTLSLIFFLSFQSAVCVVVFFDVSVDWKEVERMSLCPSISGPIVFSIFSSRYPTANSTDSLKHHNSQASRSVSVPYWELIDFSARVHSKSGSFFFTPSRFEDEISCVMGDLNIFRCVGLS